MLHSNSYEGSEQQAALLRRKVLTRSVNDLSVSKYSGIYLCFVELLTTTQMRTLSSYDRC
jgi:hypothetical protein